jgi:hypothetical protein
MNRKLTIPLTDYSLCGIFKTWHGTSSSPANMKELRGKVEDRYLRVLYAFDPRRTALLLLGGDKTGDPQWYDKFVPIADDLFDQHLRQLKRKRQR